MAINFSKVVCITFLFQFLLLHSQESLTQKEFTIAFLSLKKIKINNIKSELFQLLSPQKHYHYLHTSKYNKIQKQFTTKLKKTVATWKIPQTDYKITLTGIFGDYNFKKQRFKLRGIISEGEQKLYKPILLYRSTSIEFPSIRFLNTKKFRYFFVPLNTAKQLYDSRKFEQPMNRNVQLDIYAKLIKYNSKKNSIEFTISRIEVFNEKKNLLSIMEIKK
ncbi:hypothetical protein [Candidatus Uabimicrobium sp. HlEnr_7]|uniref:hypothetical protein n=1 Tax=Candidatus Uabimicrobium helgolandensis TaxID=3095367 RepID=UPI003558B975